MMKTLKRKFMFLSMTALFVLLAAIITGMNLINYRAIAIEADITLSVLSDNQGRFPDFKPDDVPKHMTPETPYESRYFSVLLDENNHVIQADTSRIKAIGTEQAVQYADTVIQEGQQQGFTGEFRFLCCPEGTSTRIIFLDCGRNFETFHRFLTASIVMALAGYLVFFFVLLFFSGRIVKPVSESYEKQKQFITDAGHEIKTPLTIIQADAEVLELEIGENEWLEDIRKQTRRLTGLTNDLVCLSRMEESAGSMQMIAFPFSDVVEETASSFQAPAQTQDKIFQCTVQPMISFVGDEKAICQLVTILLDNAIKYSPAQGTISLRAQKQGRQIRLTVCNTVETPISKEELNLMFERFYRIDSSRSSQTGGYGIGLSLAKAIAISHKGKISAASTESNGEHTLEITVLLPVSPT